MSCKRTDHPTDPPLPSPLFAGESADVQYRSLFSESDDPVTFRCKLCPFSADYLSSIYGHVVRAHSDRVKKSHSCVYCQGIFGSMGSLRVHISRNHRELHRAARATGETGDDVNLRLRVPPP